MKRLLLLALACNLTGQQTSPTAQPQSEKRCGDAVCDGPENAQTCPQDCAAALSGEETTSEAEASGNPPALPADGEVTYGYVYLVITLNPAVTNPECSGKIEGKPFHFQGMGTRENGLTELILSANPIEHAWGSCMQAGFDWETSHLLYGWAEAVSGDPTDLRVELNDTFRELPGQYTFLREIDTNPSPEKRDHVKVELGFFCTGDIASETTAPAPCPWE